MDERVEVEVEEVDLESRSQRRQLAEQPVEDADQSLLLESFEIRRGARRPRGELREAARAAAWPGIVVVAAAGVDLEIHRQVSHGGEDHQRLGRAIAQHAPPEGRVGRTADVASTVEPQVYAARWAARSTRHRLQRPLGHDLDRKARRVREEARHLGGAAGAERILDALDDRARLNPALAKESR